MKKAGLKSRGGGGAGRGGKQPSYHAPPRHHANGHGGPADVGGAGGGVGNDFLRDQNHAPAGNGNPAAKPSYQKGSNFQPMTGGVGGGRATGAQGRHLQQQQPQHPLPQGPGGYPQHPQPQRGPYAPQHGGGAPARNGGGGPNALMRLRQQRQQTDEMAISQKNHRLAKELVRSPTIFDEDELNAGCTVGRKYRYYLSLEEQDGGGAGLGRASLAKKVHLQDKMSPNASHYFLYGRTDKHQGPFIFEWPWNSPEELF